MKTKVYALDGDYLVVKELKDKEEVIEDFKSHSVKGEDYNEIIRFFYNETLYEVNYGMDYEPYVLNLKTDELEEGDSGYGWTREYVN